MKIIKYEDSNSIINIIKDIKKDLDDNPFYLIDIDEIINIYNKWINILPNIKPYYAIKCNTNINIIKILAKLGCCFDCASKNELLIINKIVDNKDKIIFANPVKFISHLHYAYNNNINYMTFDSIEELYKIKLNHFNPKLILRIAVDDSKSLCKFNIKFGLDISNILEIIETIKLLNLNLVGISFHVGSGCNSADIYYNALKTCFEIYNILKDNNIIIDIIDIGGGFQNKNFDDIALNIKKAQNDFFKDINIKFIAEPGRLFIENSHKLILTVVGKKKDNNSFKYYINEGVYGSFNCIHNDHQKPNIILLNKRNNNEIEYDSIIFGPTCDSIDIIYKDIKLPELFLNEILIIENFGAYTISGSSSFNGFELKDFIYIHKNDINTIQIN